MGGGLGKTLEAVYYFIPSGWLGVRMPIPSFSPFLANLLKQGCQIPDVLVLADFFAGSDGVFFGNPNFVGVSMQYVIGTMLGLKGQLEFPCLSPS